MSFLGQSPSLFLLLLLVYFSSFSEIVVKANEQQDDPSTQPETSVWTRLWKATAKSNPQLSSVAGTNIEVVYEQGMSWEPTALDQCMMDGEAQTINGTVLLNFEGNPDVLTEEDYAILAETFLETYNDDFGIDACIQILNVTVDDSVEEVEDDNEGDPQQEPLKRRKLMDDPASSAPSASLVPSASPTVLFTYNFSLFFFIIFQCHFCASGTPLFCDCSRRRRLEEKLQSTLNHRLQLRRKTEDVLVDFNDQQRCTVCSRTCTQFCQGPNRLEFTQEYDATLELPEVREVVESLVVVPVDCASMEIERTLSLAVSVEGDYSYLLDPQDDELAVVQRAVLRSYNTLNAANSETCDLQHRRILKATFQRAQAAPERDDQFVILFQVTYSCRGCDSETDVPTLFFKDDGSNDDVPLVPRDKLNVDYRDRGPVAPDDCLCSPEATQFRAPTEDEFTSVLSEMITIRKEQAVLSFVTNVRPVEGGTSAVVGERIVDLDLYNEMYQFPWNLHEWVFGKTYEDSKLPFYNIVSPVYGQFGELIQMTIQDPFNLRVFTTVSNLETVQTWDELQEGMDRKDDEVEDWIKKFEYKAEIMIGSITTFTNEEVVFAGLSITYGSRSTNNPTAVLIPLLGHSSPPTNDNDNDNLNRCGAQEGGCCSENFQDCVKFCGSTEDECSKCGPDFHWICPERGCLPLNKSCMTNPNGCCDKLTCVYVNPNEVSCQYLGPEEDFTPLSNFLQYFNCVDFFISEFLEQLLFECANVSRDPTSLGKACITEEILPNLYDSEEKSTLLLKGTIERLRTMAYALVACQLKQQKDSVGSCMASNHRTTVVQHVQTVVTEEGMYDEPEQLCKETQDLVTSKCFKCN